MEEGCRLCFGDLQTALGDYGEAVSAELHGNNFAAGFGCDSGNVRGCPRNYVSRKLGEGFFHCFSRAQRGQGRSFVGVSEFVWGRYLEIDESFGFQLRGGPAGEVCRDDLVLRSLVVLNGRLLSFIASFVYCLAAALGSIFSVC